MLVRMCVRSGVVSLHSRNFSPILGSRQYASVSHGFIPRSSLTEDQDSRTHQASSASGFELSTLPIVLGLVRCS